MKSTNRARYQPVDNGYEIVGSREIFNRTLYGSHANDDLPERYFTFAGDLPIIMGAVTDWSKQVSGAQGVYAKSGVLMSGLASTSGKQTPFFVAKNADLSSRWFHQSEDVVAIFRNGWMEYESRQFSPWAAKVKINMTALPLMPEKGFLVRYRIETDQRVVFCAGFGGMTDFIGRFEHAEADVRNFHASDCECNQIVCGRDRALIKDSKGNSMWIGASFPVNIGIGDAAAFQDSAPGMFLASEANEQTPPVVKISSPIGPGKMLDGFLVVIRNEDEGVLDKWLRRDDPVQCLKQQIHLKRTMITAYTPDQMLNQTLPPTVLGMDASWHGNTFYHGAVGDHAPFMGWRSWYGATVSGCHDRVGKAIRSHFAEIVKRDPGKEEKVWYDGKDRPDLDHEGTQYHHLQESYGYIPCMLGRNDIYNMQEVAVDMLLHHLEWTNDLKLANEIFDDLTGVLEWEERILDPDKDGLYQNFLNTWISDGHSYNGGGCAQSSSYNYHANLMMAKIAEKLNRSGELFNARARKIFDAMQSKLWLSEKGVFAEYIDTIGNRLVHPSPELSTIYLAIDCGLADMFQAYRMLRFTETELCNERTLNDGRLVYSSNWLPKKYSTCCLSPAENNHLALVYFKMGLKDKGIEILEGIRDAYFSGRNPGMVTHILTGKGWSDGGDWDFSDVSSTYLRLIVEGLFGIRFHLLNSCVEIAPNFPYEWSHSNLKLKDISLNYFRDGRQENFNVFCDATASKKFRIAMRSTKPEAVFLNGEPVKHNIEASVNNSFLTVETDLSGQLHLQVVHGGTIIPCIAAIAPKVIQGNEFSIEVSDGEVVDCREDPGVLENITFVEDKVYAKAAGIPGNYTLFIRVRLDEFDSWLAADFSIVQRMIAKKTLSCDNQNFEPLDISKYFNSSTSELHRQEYKSPRPAGYSIGARINGRYAWEWNHCGHNAVKVDDTALRQAKGLFYSPAGIGFSTPVKGHNVACASIWDNFPSVIEIPLEGKALELALFFIGVTNPMQSRVENARFTVTYLDGSTQKVSLVHPDNFDDWLVPALQTENETVYFSDYNHGIVQRIALNPKKEMAKISIEAIANEVIVGLIGISMRKQ